MPPKSSQQPKSRKTTVEEVGRAVLYPEYSVNMAVGDSPITVQIAKDLLGWEEESEQVKFGDKYLLSDRHKVKIRCRNNINNRPLTMGNCEVLIQEILNKRWAVNGEPIIIGRTGLVLNGQHSLIGLILAAQDWEGEDHWKQIWSTEPTMEKLIVLGISEEDRVVNTMDTCKPRTLAEVLYRSEFFAKMGVSDRKLAARICDYAIRWLWHRTGAGIDAFAPRRTHAESLDFLTRHPRLLRAVKHIMQENAGQKESDKGEIQDGDKVVKTDRKLAISNYISPGYASAMLYLMGCSATDPNKYQSAEVPNEKQLDFSHWDKACAFWTAFGITHGGVDAVRTSIGKLMDVDSGTGGSLHEKMGIISKGWLHFVASDNPNIKESDIKVKQHVNADGIKELLEVPTVGGIDLGNPKEAAAVEVIPTPEEIAAEKERVKQEAMAKKAAKKLSKVKPEKDPEPTMSVPEGTVPPEPIEDLRERLRREHEAQDAAAVSAPPVPEANEVPEKPKARKPIARKPGNSST